MKIEIVSFTKQGGELCLRLQYELNKQGYAADGHSKYNVDGVKPLADGLKDFTQKVFNDCDSIIFIGAAGIAVRAISPFVISKDRDPAVLVIDEKGRYVIPVLSGHIGGANKLAEIIAGVLGAQAVITTATDINDRFTVDTWAVNAGCHIDNIEKIKEISAAILNGEQVGICSDFPIEGELPKNVVISGNTRVGICISPDYSQCFSQTLHLVPKQYVLGIGCRKNTTYEALSGFVNSVLLKNGIRVCEIKAIASIDLKAQEEALLMLSRQWRIPFHTYSAGQLSQVEGKFTPSDFVKGITGVDNVCERAAIKANAGKLVVDKISGNGVTAAVSKKEWRCRF